MLLSAGISHHKYTARYCFGGGRGGVRCRWVSATSWIVFESQLIKMEFRVVTPNWKIVFALNSIIFIISKILVAQAHNGTRTRSRAPPPSRQARPAEIFRKKRIAAQSNENCWKYGIYARETRTGGNWLPHFFLIFTENFERNF